MLDMIFIESTSFTKTIYSYLSEEEYKNFQIKLTEQPHLENVIPGCGGIRKVRWAQESKSRGKRGGIRVFYLYIDEKKHIYLLAILGKSEKDDLTFREKKALKDLAIRLKKSAQTGRI